MKYLPENEKKTNTISRIVHRELFIYTSHMHISRSSRPKAGDDKPGDAVILEERLTDEGDQESIDDGLNKGPDVWNAERPVPFHARDHPSPNFVHPIQCCVFPGGVLYWNLLNSKLLARPLICDSATVINSYVYRRLVLLLCREPKGKSLGRRQLL